MLTRFAAQLRRSPIRGDSQAAPHVHFNMGQHVRNDMLVIAARPHSFFAIHPGEALPVLDLTERRAGRR